ncbi:MAG: sigma-70 family RNA polymerase sigma factor [Deltaproteobacteria bacterium]|nr:sigma-70 family RNA polymerase sigma factor [Deltaproteobacteria bacterium]
MNVVDEVALCRRFARRLRLYGMRHLRSAAAADDLAQQVLVTVIDALRADRVRDLERLDGFVLGTARRIAMDWTRTERRRELLRDRIDATLDDVVEPRPAVDVERLRGCLQALAERDRLVVVATFYVEEDTADLARRLGLEAPHVRVIRHRALTRLQRCMGVEEAAP